MALAIFVKTGYLIHIYIIVEDFPVERSVPFEGFVVGVEYEVTPAVEYPDVELLAVNQILCPLVQAEVIVVPVKKAGGIW